MEFLFYMTTLHNLIRQRQQASNYHVDTLSKRKKEIKNLNNLITNLGKTNFHISGDS
jgi:hypothetical protein